ncbi:MAG: DUF485 domain-containing protein [Gemmatimonadetes bacterium]|nr:DUF485 domain-containing protein [Gemmatimonadota bacterium]
MTPSPAPPAASPDAAALARARWRVAAALTAAMVCVYFGFIGLVAWRRDWLATPLGEGLTVGIVLGALVIVAAWGLTWRYVRWTRAHYDPALAALRAHRQGRKTP